MSMQFIKELRERTGAGMIDCKNALAQSDNDIEKAIEWLREKGITKAAKKSGRVAAEGLIGISVDGNSSAIVEINTETDFVAKNVDFQAYVKDVANQVLKSDASDVETLLSQNWQDTSKTVADVLTEKIATIGENITIRRFEKMDSNGVTVSYLHNGGKIGVVVNLETDSKDESLKEVAKNIAMHVAAINPIYLSKDQVSADYIAREREIAESQIKEDPKMSSKPENIIKNMVEGKINKQLKEVCLLEQAYVKDSSLTVAKYVEQEAKRVNANVKVKSFVRYEAGEGIEKKNESFAEEVAKQLGDVK